MVTDAKIAQEWRCSDWTEPHTSKVVILLKRVPLGTEMSFSQVRMGRVNVDVGMCGNVWVGGEEKKKIEVPCAVFEHSFWQQNVPVEKYKGVVDIWEKYFWKNIRKEIKTNYDALSSN